MVNGVWVRSIGIIVSSIVVITLALMAGSPVACAGGAISVEWEGHVYYSDGTTPVEGATVNIFYPPDAIEPTYVQGTMSDGSYQAGGILYGKSYRIVAVKDGVSASEISGTIYNTGVNPIIVENDIVMPLTAPATTRIVIDGYVTRGGSPADATVYVVIGGTTSTVSTNPATGYYYFETTSGSPVSARLFAAARGTSICSLNYDCSNILPGTTVRQDIEIPAQTVTFNIRVLNNGAPATGARAYVSYGGSGFNEVVNSEGRWSITTAYYSGYPAYVSATYDGRNSECYQVDATPDGTVNYDINFGSATPTTTVTPAPAVSHNPGFYIFTSIDGVNVNDVLVTCQFDGVTYSATSHYMDIEDTGVYLSYHGPGVLYLEVPRGHTGTAVFHASKGSYAGDFVTEVTAPSSVIMTGQIVLTPRAAAATTTATPVITVSPTLVASPTLTVTPAVSPIAVSPTSTAGSNDTGVSGGTIAAGTNATIAPTAARTVTPSAGFYGVSLIHIVAGIAGLILVILIIGAAYVLLNRK